MLQVSLQDAARTCVNARRYVYIHLIMVYRTRVRDHVHILQSLYRYLHVML